MSENKSDRYSHGDPSLRTGEGGLTVWTLQRMAQEEQYDELDKLFNNGLTMAALPVGLAAGTAVPTVGLGSSLIPKVLDNLTIQSKYLEVDSKQFSKFAMLPRRAGLARKSILPLKAQERFRRQKPSQEIFGAAAFPDRAHGKI